MNWLRGSCLVLVLVALFWSALADRPAEAQEATQVVVYCGRSRSFMDQLFDRFEKDTGITVARVYGETAEIALKLQTEGARSPADLVLAQDAGALGALSRAGLLAELPSQVTQRVDARFVSGADNWVATSLRARTLAYSAPRISRDELPHSVFDLTDARYHGRVGWSPANASFQAFITAMRTTHGQERTRQWLIDMKANAAKAYPKNTAIIQAIAAGEIDLGLPNHYYLVRFKMSDPKYPVEQTSFADGDIGNMVNVAGAAVLRSSRRQAAALKLVEYLLSPAGQGYFVNEIHEYPVVPGLLPSEGALELMGAPGGAPALDLNTIDDLAGTLDLLREVGLL